MFEQKSWEYIKDENVNDYERLYNKYSNPGVKSEDHIVEIEHKRVQKLSWIVKSKEGIFVMLKRQKNMALFKKIAYKENGKYVFAHYDYFEVILIGKMDYKKHLSRMNKSYGMSYDLENSPHIKETYPTDKEFGYKGWAYRELESAERKFKELAEIEENKHG